MSIIVFISLGGNLGNTLQIFKNSYLEIEKKIGRIVKFSKVYQTEAWGKTDQPEFLNQVIQVETDVGAEYVMSQLFDIELFFGRTRDEIWGPRILDLDILFYANQIIRTNNLVIPHPQIANRRFVLIPLVEIAPNFKHPVENKIMLELLEQSTDLQSVKAID